MLLSALAHVTEMGLEMVSRLKSQLHVFMPESTELDFYLILN